MQMMQVTLPGREMKEKERPHCCQQKLRNQKTFPRGKLEHLYSTSLYLSCLEKKEGIQNERSQVIRILTHFNATLFFQLKQVLYA